MAKLVLIGCSPSSGSTMFADLLDSSEFSACGPELEFFCNRRLFDFEQFKKKPHTQSELFSIGSTGIFPRYGRLNYYGLGEASLNNMIESSDSLPDFCDSFATHFASLRGKKDDSIVFEKTPQNTNTIDLWIDESDDNHFVFLIRHPFYVFNSLMNRGWSLYTAVTTWLSYLGKALSYFEHPRVHWVKLEELVQDPFVVTANLINAIHRDSVVSEEQIQNGYANNLYRKESSKSKSEWEIQGAASGIQNPNSKEITSKRLEQFYQLAKVKLSDAYGNRFHLQQIALDDAMSKLGYVDDNWQHTSSISLKPRLVEHTRFLAKTLRSVQARNGGLEDWNIYSKALS